MPQRVQAPDGSIVEFPDGMDDAQIAGVMRKEYGGPDNRPKSQSLGFVKGLMKPIDNGAMALEAGARAMGVPTDKINNVFAMPSAQEATDQRAQAIAASPNRPGAIGEVAGNIVGTIPAIAATRNPFIAGGLQGAALTDSRNPFGVAQDAAGGAVLNWAGGKLVDAAADVIKPVIDPAVQRLKDAGVRLSPGMVKGGKAMTREDKRMSRPVVGGAIGGVRRETQDTLNIAAVNEALSPLGKKVPSAVRPGFDALDYAKTEIGRAYDTVVPNLAVSINGQQFMQPIAQLASTLPKAEQATLRKIATATLRNGQLSGQALKDAQGELRRLASSYGRDQAAPARELGRVLSAMDDQLTREMLAQNPKWAPELQRANEAYRGYRIVADAAGRGDDGIFTTGQLKQSVRRGDRSKSKDASARGDAFMQGFSNDARAVIPARAPNPSGTAAHMLGGNPFAIAGGAKDAALFGIDDAYQQFRLAPRPAGAAPAARAVRRLKGPVAAGGVALSHQSRD